MAVAKSVSSSDVVVWCHFSRNVWLAFEPDLSNYVENVYSTFVSNPGSSSSIVDIRHLSSKFLSHQIDLNHFKLISPFGDNQIDRRVLPPGSVYANNIVWEFEGDPYNTQPWIPYDTETSQLLENAHKSKSKTKKKLDLMTTLQLPYIIDVKKMIQENTNTLKKRKIKRRKLGQPNYAPNTQLGATAITLPGVTRKRTVPSDNTSGRGHKRSGSPQLPYEFTEELPVVTQITINDNDSFKTDNCTDFLSKFTRQIVLDDEEEDEPSEENTDDCPICVERLADASGYGEGRDDAHEILELRDCHHRFHKLCIEEMYRSRDKNGFLECPNCKRIHGEKHGDCPAGRMEWSVRKDLCLPGYKEFHTLQVSYTIYRGIQGKGHPNPGRPFNARGFPRVGYIPDCDKGRKVLKLLMEAFRRHLMFTIGTSSTTSESDTVIWNDIHHKTEPLSNNRGHGYPDPSYLDNVLMELCAQGVTQC